MRDWKISWSGMCVTFFKIQPQVNCRNTAGCGHFTFHYDDGNCKIYGLDAIWLPEKGAESGPARCVAQVRLTLQDLGDLAELEKEKDILQVEIANELAKSAKIPVHDIRDMAGQVGKVTLSADTSAAGKLIMDSFVDLPAGSKLQDKKVFGCCVVYPRQKV